MKKTIAIKFIGFWIGFKDNDNFIYNTLKKYYNVELSDAPDYLFYSTFCPNNFDYVNYDCVRIFYSGENASPDFNYCDYAISFDNIIYNDRYIRFPLFLAYKQLPDAVKKHKNITVDTYNSKEHFCNFIVGNTQGMPERTDIFNKLNRYKQVSSCGTYLTNTYPIVTNEDEKLAFQEKCRFTIAFESVKQPGFVTKKILHAFAAKTVPIYYGDKDITDIFNPDSFINAHNYNDHNKIVEKVKEIEETPELWCKMVSTPCFVDPEYPEKKWKELELFLCNIMDQDIEKAYRRPLKFHRVRYSKDLKFWVALKSKINFMKGPAKFVVRILKKLKS